MYNRARRLSARLTAPDVCLVADTPQWVFHWIVHYVVEHLRGQRAVRAGLVEDPWPLKRRIIHFISRYAYLNGPFRELHESNRVFVSWFHGDPSSEDPEMRSLFDRMRAAAPFVERIVASCRLTREALIRAEIPEDKVTTIPLGVDLSCFRPPTPAERAEARRALGIPSSAICIGSFQKDGTGWGEGNEPKLVKGPDVFLRVVEELAKGHKNLVIVLTGPSRGYVKQGLKRMGVPFVHRFLQDYTDILRYYHVLDIYLIASRDEGGPAAFLESWAAGVPVVSTRVGMPADLIRHGENGLLAEVENVAALTECANSLIEDHSLADNCRSQALEDAKSLDWSFVAGRYYEGLYEPLLRGPDQRRPA